MLSMYERELDFFHLEINMACKYIPLLDWEQE